MVNAVTAVTGPTFTGPTFTGITTTTGYAAAAAPSAAPVQDVVALSPGGQAALGILGTGSNGTGVNAVSSAASGATNPAMALTYANAPTTANANSAIGQMIAGLLAGIAGPDTTQTTGLGGTGWIDLLNAALSGATNPAGGNGVLGVSAYQSAIALQQQSSNLVNLLL